MSSALALNIYCWDTNAQNRLLAEVMAPWVQEQGLAGQLELFLFDRFDARGPHLFFILGAADEATLDRFGEETGERIARFLKDSPSPSFMSQEEVQARHDACRGKTLCALDRLDGLAANNTYLLAAHTSQDYPFRLWSDLTHAEAFLRAFGAQSIWAMGEVAGRSGGLAMGPGLRWLASVDRMLHRAGLDPEAYWRYHVGTLVPSVVDELKRSSPAVVAANLAPLISANNAKTFARVWELLEKDVPEDPRAIRLVELLATERSRDRLQVALREAIHLTLKQLGFHLSLQVPMVVYTWRQCFEQQTSGVNENEAGQHENRLNKMVE